MRVMRTLELLLVMLLVLSVLAPAAGAIYIEGQTIPDDGLMHIMSAEDGTVGSAPAGMPDDMDASDAIPAGVLPSYVLDDSPTVGYAMLPAGFPAMLEADTMPVSMMPSEESILAPVSMVPSTVAVPEEDTVIGSTALPVNSGIWDFFDTGSLQTNMPVLSNWFF